MDEASYELLVQAWATRGPPASGTTARTTASRSAPPCRRNAETEQRVAGAVANMQRQIHCVFVEQPYDYLNWVRPLTGECADRRNQILAHGPHERDDEPRDMMNGGVCSRLP